MDTRVIRVLMFQCCVAAALLCGSSTAAAQSVLSCDSRTEIVREGLPRLAAYQPGPSQLAALKKARHRRFGPFDHATYGFTNVDIYLESLGASEDSFLGHFGPVEIVVRLGSRTPRWFKVVLSADEPADRRMLFGYKDIGVDPESEPVRLATDDPRVPLFVVRLGEDTGRGSVEWQHVIDLRPNRPRVPVAIQCYTLENQGACGTWDAQFGDTRTSASCAWEPTLGDFRCAMTEQLQTTWGGRTSHIEQTLIDKGRLPPRSLDDVLQRLVKAGPEDIDAALAAVSDFTGPARLVMQRPTPDGGTWMLVGVGGRASFFDARFVVIRVQNGQPTVHDVIEAPLGPDYWRKNDSDREQSASMLHGRVTPTALAMQGTIVFEQADLIVAQVHVREGEVSPSGSTAGQAIYWVGISLSSSGLTASSLRLATDTSEYFSCARTATPPNALAWTVKPAGTFTAEVEIEPPYEVDLFTGEPLDDEEGLELDAPACATTAVVTWRDGFAISHQDKPSTCREDLPARFVRIDDRGRIQLADKPGATGLERH